MECLKTVSIRKLELEHRYILRPNLSSDRLWIVPKRCTHLSDASSKHGHRVKLDTVRYPLRPQFWKHSLWRSCASSLNLDEDPSLSPEEEQLSNNGEVISNDPSRKLLSRPMASDEMKSLLADAERSKLLRKLSEANQYSRFLKRQLQVTDNVLAKLKSELAVLELELQALVGLAEEIASDVPSGSRKITGKYIQSHLFSRLEAVREKVKEQIKDADSLGLQEITVFWVGMAESVQVMGSFDGWSQGEEMSREYSGDYARFSATVKLRPGKYEIKFLVDGEWQLSPEFPTVGEDMTKNNLLIVQ
ncbi:protein PTST, chloroplastic [Ananas comosus]|uniref:Protein PTST, chloroplastic n=1 Tax=Ananas comosus TaxID=4615 RepID=A0A6P5FV98_ANACO|nr:protein PTST, chloroplastic [Ananas comosus]XP_020100237.1 protein PTST, chloroplastic [Ananas comosus]